MGANEQTTELTALCPTCRLPLDATERDRLAERGRHDVTCWTCEALGDPCASHTRKWRYRGWRLLILRWKWRGGIQITWTQADRGREVAFMGPQPNEKSVEEISAMMERRIATPLCPTCRLPLDADARREQADEEPGGDVTCWICEECELPAWGWDWDDDAP